MTFSQFYVYKLYLLYVYLLQSFLLRRLTRNNTIAAHDRLTIYFHAVLSKDFKFDPGADRIFIQAGRYIGSWDKNVVELFVSRYLFFNEAQMVVKKYSPWLWLEFGFAV